MPKSPELQQFYDDHALLYRGMSSDEIEGLVEALVDDHAQYMDYECLNLYAGTNILNPKAARMLSASIGTRPSLGYAGDKYEMGMQYAEQLEILAAELLKEIFKCEFVEFRVGSGSLANLYAFMATCQPGDVIFSFSEGAAGHVTHRSAGAAGLYGLRILDVPFDPQQMTVDLENLARLAQKERPKLIIIAGSMCLFPYPVAAVRAIADEIGAYVMYDAAHMSGLIAGGAFQQPLAEGAHLMTTSTYKSFGGPPSGLVLTNSPELAERLDQIAYPGLTANFDLGKLAALTIAALDIRDFGADYAQMCIANAQALALALSERACEVYQVAGKGFTASQHLALPAAGGGHRGCKLLERANILASGIGLPLPPAPDDPFNAIRLGTQELTRWGMQPEHMPQVAELISRIWVKQETPETLKAEVMAFREGFQHLHYVHWVE